MRRFTFLVAAVLAPAGAALAGFIPFQRPANAVDATDPEGRVTIGYEYGVELNRITIFSHSSRAERSGSGPLEVDNTFARREVTTLEQWQKAREQIKSAVMNYFGQMPAMDMPLDPKVDSEEDRGDHLLRIVSYQFGGGQRGRIGLLIPKGLPAPGPVILICDAWGNGVERIASGVYSRTLGLHLVRAGVVIGALDHWYEVFGTSSRLCTMGAAVHNIRRAVSYLETQKDLVNPKQIGLLGHVYGAEITFFAGGIEDRLAALAASNSWFQPTAPYTAAFWGPPYWATGSGQGLGDATERASKEMYCSNRDVAISPLPFLTQQFMALNAPKPLLTINHGLAYGGKIANNGAIHAIWPAYELYSKNPPVEMIGHKLGSNFPPNVRDHIVDFFLRAMADVNPGHADQDTEKKVLAELQSDDPARQIRACRLAGWWRCAAAVPALVKLLGQPKEDPKAEVQLTDPQLPLRRAAAKALERCGAVKELFAYVKDPDPVVRLTVVEAIFIHGADKPTWKALEKLEFDREKWVKEAKWQTLQVNPYE